MSHDSENFKNTIERKSKKLAELGSILAKNQLIDKKNLTNQIGGYESSDFGRMDKSE